MKVAALRRGFVRDGEGGAGGRAAHGGGVDFEMPIGDGGYPRGAIDVVVPTTEPISSIGLSRCAPGATAGGLLRGGVPGRAPLTTDILSRQTAAPALRCRRRTR